MNPQKRKIKILVLGGKGFIGRQIVTNLVSKAEVTVGTRKIDQDKGQLCIAMQTMLTLKAWESVLTGFDIVINSVGILRERKGESYDAVHAIAVANLSNACALLNISLIHISAIGLTGTAQSQFIRSKYAGEQAIKRSGANAVIVRPSLLDGEGGYGAKWFRRVASWPIQFVMQSKGLVAPLHVTDLGEAIAKLVFMPENNRPQLVELGSVESYSIPEYLTLLRRAKGRSVALQIAVPIAMVCVVSHLFDLLAWTPLSFGHFELMQGYNVPSKNLLPQLLGRNPKGLGSDNKAAGGEMYIFKS